MFETGVSPRLGHFFVLTYKSLTNKSIGISIKITENPPKDGIRVTALVDVSEQATKDSVVPVSSLKRNNSE